MCRAILEHFDIPDPHGRRKRTIGLRHYNARLAEQAEAYRRLVGVLEKRRLSRNPYLMPRAGVTRATARLT